MKTTSIASKSKTIKKKPVRQPVRPEAAENEVKSRVSNGTTSECRLCLSVGASIDIFNSPEPLAQHIRNCCELQVEKDDGLSEKICESCESKLTFFSQFISTCHRSNKILIERTSKNIKVKLERVFDVVKCEQGEEGEDVKPNVAELPVGVMETECQLPIEYVNSGIDTEDVKPTPQELSMYAETRQIKEES